MMIFESLFACLSTGWPEPRSENIVSSCSIGRSSSTSRFTISISCFLPILSRMVERMAPDEIPSQSVWLYIFISSEDSMISFALRKSSFISGGIVSIMFIL